MKTPSPFSTSLSLAHWLWHRCFLLVSPKPSSPYGCILSRIRDVFLTSPAPSFAVLVRSVTVFVFTPLSCFNWPFCMFLSQMTFYLGGYDYSVPYTTAQLTEGRSAWDQPQQKKNCTFPFGVLWGVPKRQWRRTFRG